MNDAMSAGLHRLWKDQLVDTLGPMRGTTIVDLAGGTGDVAFRIMEKLKQQPVPRGEGQATRLVHSPWKPNLSPAAALSLTYTARCLETLVIMFGRSPCC